MKLELKHRLRVTLAADDPRVADGALVNYAPRLKGRASDEYSDMASDIAASRGGFREVWLEPGTVLDLGEADGSWCIDRLSGAVMLAENANRATRTGAMFLASRLDPNFDAAPLNAARIGGRTRPPEASGRRIH